MPSAKSDHLRNPVTRSVEWLKPFEADYARPIVGLGEPDLRDALSKLADEDVGCCCRIRRHADAYDVVKHVGEGARIEREYGWHIGQPRSGFDNFVVVEGANIAKPLGQNEFRRACLQRVFIKEIESFARLQELTDSTIDLVAGKTMRIDGASHHNGFLLRFSRVVALMRDADDLIAKTERKRDFRRAGK